MARRRTVADQLVAQIVAAGARHVYGIVGDSLNPVVDAIRRAAADGADRVVVNGPDGWSFAD